MHPGKVTIFPRFERGRPGGEVKHPPELPESRVKITIRILGVGVVLTGLGGLTFALNGGGGRPDAKGDTSPTPAREYT